MTGPEHYRKAEGLLENAWKRVGGPLNGDWLHPAETRALLVAQAQAHATLALTAATLATANRHIDAAWNEATS